MAPARWATAAGPRTVPRQHTVVVMRGGREGRWTDHELWNPYAIGGNHQDGSGLLYEPLAYYSALAVAGVHPWAEELVEPGESPGIRARHLDPKARVLETPAPLFGHHEPG